MQPLLGVERYAERWPLIPLENLQAGSVQHPAHEDWRRILYVQ